MSFSSSKDAMVNVVTIPTKRVREILAMNRAGKKVESLIDKDSIVEVEEPTFRTEEDSITRFDNQNKRRRNNRKGNNKEQRRNKVSGKPAEGQAPAENGNKEGKEGHENHNRHEHRQRRDNRPNRAERNEATPQTAAQNPDGNAPKEQHEGQRYNHNRRNFRDRHNRHNNRRNHEGGNNGGDAQGGENSGN